MSHVYTEEELHRTLGRVSFAPSCLALAWEWETRHVYAMVDDETEECVGWLVRTSFLRPDTASGKIDRGFGREEFVAIGTTESGIVKTAWLLCELIVLHELREAFLVDGIRVFNPHHTIEDLQLPHRIKLTPEGSRI